MCQLFESIRIEYGYAHHVLYHQQRVDRSIACHRINLESYIKQIDLPKTGCFKLRITYTSLGVVEHSISPYTARIIESLKVVTDDSIRYDRKLNDRQAINRLFDQRGNCDDILIVRNGMITDSSFSNIALWDGYRWATPIEPLLFGTCRARMIEFGTLTPMSIELQNLKKYSKLMLINAMIGFDENRTIDTTTSIIHL